MAGFVDKFKRMWDAPDDEYEYSDYDDYEGKNDRNRDRRADRDSDAEPRSRRSSARYDSLDDIDLSSRDTTRRNKVVIDFLSGVAYANRGKIKKVATSTFIIIPNNVDLTGDDLLDELEHSGVYF